MTTTNNEAFSAYLPEKVANKNIIITGGTTGIGRATAQLLAMMGNKVLICGRHQDELEEAIASFEKSDNSKGSLSGVIADLSSENGVLELFQKADEKFERLDILVNNAALAYGSVEEGSYEDQEYLLKTNLLGYFACTKQAIAKMKQGNGGHIVNVGSMSADVREADSSVYVATKGAIQAFSEALRKEVNKSGIKVTLIEPGATGTDMQPMPASEQRELEEKEEMLKAEDIASAIVFALSQPKRSDVVSVKIRPHLQLI